tara:strand:+ start:1518 stop:2678 length:1161 start_codon:yes stop_codon:yes gene_type:complete
MLNTLKNKYHSILDNCSNDEKQIEKTDNKQYVHPTYYRVSTMTIITSFTCYINLEVVSKYFKLDNIIISMVYGDKPVKNSKKKKNRPFFNQATIIVKLDPIRKVNVKIFSNGQIQMTGVKKLEDGHEALTLIINKLKNTFGIIPLNKHLDSQLEDIYSKEREGDHFKDSYPIDNATLFRERLILEIEKILGVDELKCHCIEENEKFKYNEFQVVLINSDFNINFKIRRDILYSILKNDYHIVSTFFPGIYPGVNNKFYWNKLYKDDPSKKKGVCYCEKMCEGKGLGEGYGDCKKVTIAAFSSGSVIITGARKKEQIEDCYNFINGVFKKNYSKIKKVVAPFYDENKDIKNKKYVKPSDIIYINPLELTNTYNEPIINKYKTYLSKV